MQSILIMSESNRFQMALVFCKAMIIFEKRCTLNSLALSLTKKYAHALNLSVSYLVILFSCF